MAKTRTLSTSLIPDEVFHEVFHLGIAQVEEYELYSWLQKERITSRDWKRIQLAWQEYCGNEQAEIYIMKPEFSKYFFMHKETVEAIRKGDAFINIGNKETEK